jgi:hypothetical protein
MNRSQLFTQYNKARKAAREGKLDPKAVNKALGLCQSSQERPYFTTTKSCNCPAFVYGNGKACKHMVAKMLKVRIAQAEQNVTSQPKPIDPAKPKVKPILILMTGDKGESYCAEQVSGGYYIHSWSFIWEAEEFITSHVEINWVRPTCVIGRRLRPDQNH